jgi:putative ABC transport system ATP-binding protein
MQTTSDAVIIVKNLIKQVPAVNKLHNEQIDILTGVNLEIKHGESLAIIGASGSGKSTLLGLLAGLDDATDGDILIEQQNISLMTEDERASLRSEKVGFIFQSFQLLPSLTALENVMLPLELQSKKTASADAQQLLQRVGLTDRQQHYPKQLSGGEQQRVAIARAFITQPTILFADEPTGNLDKITGQNVIDLLFEMNRERNTTLVIVTHDEVLAKHCDRCLTLENGVLSEYEPVDA